MIKHKMDQNNPQPDYSFLEENEKPGYFDFFTKADKKTRIKMVAIGSSLLLLLAVIVGAIIFSNDEGLQSSLTRVAQRQNEVIRIAEIGEDKARAQEVLNASIVIKASLKSSQNQVSAALANEGGSPSRAILRQLESEQTTRELNAAEQANRFDEVYLEIMQSELLSYMASLEASYTHASGNNRKLIDNLYREAGLLLKNIEDI